MAIMPSHERNREASHRREKQRQLEGANLVIATQVIEAGVGITSEVLLTEEAPVNALVQRADGPDELDEIATSQAACRCLRNAVFLPVCKGSHAGLARKVSSHVRVHLEAGC